VQPERPPKKPADGRLLFGDRYLAIETSSPRLSLAIGDGSKVLASYTGVHHWRHAESLFDGIAMLLRRVRWPIQSITGVGVSIGPGSFTGIRIGLAVARALGQSLLIPVVGVSSLEVLAAGAKTRAKWLIPQIDALRGQVFSGIFARNGSSSLHRVVPEAMVPLAGWSKKVRRRAGRKSLWISPLQGCYPDARVLLDLARPKLAKAGPKSYQTVLPLYIRQAAAQERMA
jgi:tRNA threonylcarbamoyladenosine biosynthesis protein TsaB